MDWLQSTQPLKRRTASCASPTAIQSCAGRVAHLLESARRITRCAERIISVFPRAMSVEPAVLQLCRSGLICWADVPGILSFRSLQVAAIRTGGDPPGSGLVPAFLAFLPRRGGAAGRAGRARRPRHRLEVGAALRPGNGRSVSSIALLLVCLDWKSDSFSYRTIFRSIPKLQHYRQWRGDSG